MPLGGNAIAIETDIAKPSEIETMVARTLVAFGWLDVLH